MTTAAEKVAGNRYLLEEILILLPAKLLARSKLVSKQWLSHISNPQFVSRHSRLRSNKSPTGMFVTGSKALSSDAHFVSFNSLNPTYQTIPSLGFLNDGIKNLVVNEVSQIKILRSCNGLFLCFVSFSHPSSSSKYCVCNPTTKKFRLLPDGPAISSSREYLGFDPSVSPHYKVISPYYRHIYVYSSESHCWRVHDLSFNEPIEGPYFIGPVYSLCDDYSLCFDFYTEEMKRLRVPPNRRSWICLATDGARLLSQGHRDDRLRNVQVLEMSKDFSEWVIKYDVCVDPLLSAYPEIVLSFEGLDYEQIIHNFAPLCVIEGVKEDENGIVFGIQGKLLFYNLEHKTAKELCELHDELSCLFGYDDVKVFQFSETLSAV